MSKSNNLRANSNTNPTSRASRRHRADSISPASTAGLFTAYFRRMQETANRLSPLLAAGNIHNITEQTFRLNSAQIENDLAQIEHLLSEGLFASLTEQENTPTKMPEAEHTDKASSLTRLDR